jgi:hypothetical protein
MVGPVKYRLVKAHLLQIFDKDIGVYPFEASVMSVP